MAETQTQIQRAIADFSPSLWGDQFIKHNSDAQVAENLSKRVEELKNKVRDMIAAPVIKLVDTMSLIDTLERLGVSYHFKNEIEEILQQLFNLKTDYNDDAYDLYTVALHFRLFRQHGHPISSEIFGRWMDVNGEFQEVIKTDAKGLLSLYEASYLRTHGETILDGALDFATASLKLIAPRLEPPLRRQVVHALVQPLHFGFSRIEARNFISIYEEYEDKNEFLLKFGKLDYNLLQVLHKEELHELPRWWSELELNKKLPYARDRLVEIFFWAVGVYNEPQYSRARIIFVKTVAFTSIIDDTYDAYGTIEELDVFTKAIERWNIEEIIRLPAYLKPLYKAILELYKQFEEELAKEGRSNTTLYAIESLKELVRSYGVEAKWFRQGYLPPFEEYMKNALITSTYCYHTMTSLLGVASSIEEDFEWLNKKPKMLSAGLIICRVIDDISTYETEKDRGQTATGIDSYMKDKNATKEEAMAKFSEMATDAWKDMNEECLRLSPYSTDVVMRILNLARLIEVVYQGKEDGYTQPEKVLKPHIIALVVDPIPI